MTLTDEDKAFLIKIGQVVPTEINETKPKERKREKDEE